MLLRHGGTTTDFFDARFHTDETTERFPFQMWRVGKTELVSLTTISTNLIFDFIFGTVGVILIEPWNMFDHISMS